MKKQGLTVVISHADSTLGQRMTRILARHGAEMILLYQKFDPALRLAEKVYACGSDCVMTVSYTHLDVYKRQTMRIYRC